MSGDDAVHESGDDAAVVGDVGDEAGVGAGADVGV